MTREYPDRPFLAVSGAIFRDGKVLIVRRARRPALALYTLPGGAIETGETLAEALRREIIEETSMQIEPVALAGHREMIARDADGRVQRHFVILCFACRWISGDFSPNDELESGQWLDPEKISGLDTTEGLLEIVRDAFRLLT